MNDPKIKEWGKFDDFCPSNKNKVILQNGKKLVWLSC